MGYQGVEDVMGMAAGCGDWIMRPFTHISVNRRAERDESRYSDDVFLVLFF